MITKRLAQISLALLLLAGVVAFAPLQQAFAKCPTSMNNTKAAGCPFSMASANIVGTAESTGMFTTLLTALRATGLDGTLSSKDTMFTVFAPTDDAFKKLPAGTIEMLLKPENKAKLSEILLYHVVAEPLTAENVLKNNLVSTAQGTTLKVKMVDGKALVNDSQITKTDIYATNGIIHVIDTVLMPTN